MGLEHKIEILQMKDPSIAQMARDNRWQIDDIESAIVNPQWVMPTPSDLPACELPGILGFGYARGFDSGFGTLQYIIL